MISLGAATIFGDYKGGSSFRPSYLLRSAGASKQHIWIGPGRHMPINVPKPLFISKWIPNIDPTYKASWVPSLPASYKPRIPSHNKGSSIPHGFGPPKQSSITGAHASASFVNTQYQSASNSISNAIPHVPHSRPINLPNSINTHTNPSSLNSKNPISYPIHPPVPAFNHNLQNTKPQITQTQFDNSNVVIKPLVKAPEGDPLPLSSHEPSKDDIILINNIDTNFLTDEGEGESSYTNI